MLRAHDRSLCVLLLFRMAHKARAFLLHVPHGTPQNSCRYDTYSTGQLLAYDHVGKASVESGKGIQLAS